MIERFQCNVKSSMTSVVSAAWVSKRSFGFSVGGDTDLLEKSGEIAHRRKKLLKTVKGSKEL